MDNVEIRLEKNPTSRTGFSIIYPKGMDFDYNKLRASEYSGDRGKILVDNNDVLEFEFGKEINKNLIEIKQVDIDEHIKTLDVQDVANYYGDLVKQMILKHYETHR